MSTYGELQNRINSDYLNRTDLSAETQRAILAAVRYYERQRFRFNETATALTTSAGQSYLVTPTNLLELDLLQLTIASNDYKLIYRDFDWIKQVNSTRTRAQPSDYTIYQNRIELALIPDSAYSVNCFYLKRLPALSASSDTNAWTSGEAEDVIAYHATKIMWASVLRNPQEALIYADLERASRSELYRYREQYPHLVIAATDF